MYLKYISGEWPLQNASGMAKYMCPPSTHHSGLPAWPGDDFTISPLFLSLSGTVAQTLAPTCMTGDYLSAETGTGEEPMEQGQCIFKELTLGMKVRSFNLLIAPVK